MSELTALAKGCVVQATSGSAGYYRISGLSTRGPIFIQSVATNRNDIASAMACFDNKHQFYVFGKGFGDVVITLDAYLGNTGGADVEGAVNSFFESSRVAAKKGPITVTSRGGGAYTFYLVGMRVGATDPNTNMIRFGLIGKIVE